MRALKIYMPFTVNEIKRHLAYRVSAFGWTLVTLLTVFITYSIWQAIFNSSPNDTLRGFTFEEMAVYICMQMVTMRLISSSAGWIVGREVVQGTISASLIKPINYAARIFFQDLGAKAFYLASGGIIIMLIVYIPLGWQFDIILLLQFLLSMILSLFIYFFFDMCFSMLAFYTTYIWGLNLSKYAVLDFLSGAMIPIAFFPEGAQYVFQFLPFQYLGYAPVMIFLGKINDFWRVIGIQALWVVLLYCLSKLLWAAASKRLTILGG